MANVEDTELYKICNYIGNKGERTFQIEEVSRGLGLKRNIVSAAFNILSDRNLGTITAKGNLFPDFAKKFWKLYSIHYNFVEKWLETPTPQYLTELILYENSSLPFTYVSGDIDKIIKQLQQPTDLYRLMTQQKVEYDTKISVLEDELHQLTEKRAKVKLKQRNSGLKITEILKEFLMKKNEILSLAENKFALDKKANSWKDIFIRLSVDIPILLPRISDLLEIAPERCEIILKEFVKKDANRGKYLELEQVFIKGNALEENIEELLSLIE